MQPFLIFSNTDYDSSFYRDKQHLFILLFLVVSMSEGGSG